MKFFENFKFTNLLSKKKIDENLLDKFEELLIESDVGPVMAAQLKDEFKKEKIGKEIKDEKEIFNFLGNQISKILQPYEKSLKKIQKNSPTVVVVAGVNGVGKTTTIGKLGRLYKDEGKKIVFGAADTFRAAAIEQLEVWSKKINVDFIKSDLGSDSASVAYKTVKFAEEKKLDLALIDTAGRLQNKKNLMDEYKKIFKVLQKINSDYPHETILVLDATTGQNAINQVSEFKKASNITSLIITKLDSEARAGIILSICKKFNLPIIAVGVGEKESDLRPFNAKEFTKLMLEN
ncbi:MAG: signal recognition particle-docking protein FtsY [Pelagibacterales bacterium MED-G40]|nr:MAG: signal recognition particle-docking protein FtsY [Pelagibacterales bacterium MED-G40]